MKNGHLAVGLQNGVILILDSISFKVVNQISTSKEVFVLADSETVYLVSGVANGEIIELDIDGYTNFRISHSGTITCLLFLDDFILAGGFDDSSIRIWDLNANRLLTEFNSDSNGYPNKIGKLILFEDIDYQLSIIRNVSITNGKNNTIMIFDKYGNITLMHGHTDVVNDFILLTNNLLASASEDRVIHIWNLYTRLHKSTLVINQEVKILEYLYSTQLACGLINGDIEIWDYMYITKLYVLKGHSKPITVLKRISMKNFIYLNFKNIMLI